MKTKTKINISFTFNLAIILLCIYSFVIFYLDAGFGNMESQGQEMLCYFTVDSNILCAIASLVIIIQSIKGKGISRTAMILKYVGTVAVTLTFATVMLFLGPNIGYDQLLEGPNLFLHMICPLLAIVSFTVFEGSLMVNQKWVSASRKKPIAFKETIYGMIPVVLYGGVYIYQVLITKWWPDFYGFNSGSLEGKWYISICAMLVGNYIISVIIWALYYSLRGERNYR